MKQLVAFVALSLFLCVYEISETAATKCSINTELLKQTLSPSFSVETEKFSITDAITAINLADEALGALDKVLDAFHIGGASAYINPIRKLLGAISGLLKFISGSGPQQDSPELTYMKKEFAKMNNKLDQLMYKINCLSNSIIDQLELNNIKGQMLQFQQDVNYLGTLYDMYQRAVSEPYGSEYDATRAVLLNDFRKACEKKDPLQTLINLYTTFNRQGVADTVLKAYNWKLVDIEVFVGVFFPYIISFSQVHTACLGVKEGVTDNSLTIVNNYTFCVLEDFVTIFDNIGQRVKNEFFENNRLRDELQQMLIAEDDLQQAQSSIYAFLSQKYCFLSWYVNVCEGPATIIVPPSYPPSGKPSKY